MAHGDIHLFYRLWKGCQHWHQQLFVGQDDGSIRKIGCCIQTRTFDDLAQHPGLGSIRWRVDNSPSSAWRRCSSLVALSRFVAKHPQVFFHEDGSLMVTVVHEEMSVIPVELRLTFAFQVLIENFLAVVQGIKTDDVPGKTLLHMQAAIHCFFCHLAEEHALTCLTALLH